MISTERSTRSPAAKTSLIPSLVSSLRPRCTAPSCAGPPMMIEASIISGMPTAPALGARARKVARPVRLAPSSTVDHGPPDHVRRSPHADPRPDTTGSAVHRRPRPTIAVAANAPAYSAHSAGPTAASFNPASMRRHPTARSPQTPRRASQNPPDSPFRLAVIHVWTPPLARALCLLRGSVAFMCPACGCGAVLAAGLDGNPPASSLINLARFGGAVNQTGSSRHWLDRYASWTAFAISCARPRDLRRRGRVDRCRLSSALPMQCVRACWRARPRRA